MIECICVSCWCWIVIRLRHETHLQFEMSLLHGLYYSWQGKAIFLWEGRGYLKLQAFDRWLKGFVIFSFFLKEKPLLGMKMHHITVICCH